jgi:general secretion pathway protein M
MNWRVRLRLPDGLRERLAAWPARLGPRLAPLRARLEPYLARWRALPPRQRLVYGAGGAVLGVLFLYLLLWVPIKLGIAQMRESVPQDRQRLALMRAQAEEVAQLRASGVSLAKRGGNILATLEQAAITRGLRQNVTRMEPDGANGAQVTLEGAHFNALLSLLYDLQTQHGVRVEQATLESHAEAGHVNARLTLRGPSG